MPQVRFAQRHGSAVLQACGETFKYTCPQCHVIVDTKLRTCPHCGATLDWPIHDKAKATVGSLLSLKPILKTANGELIQAARARCFSKGMDMLFEFAKDTPGPQEVAIVHST